MKILLKKVYDGATYQGKVYDYGIHIETKSGLEVVLFDGKRYGITLRGYEGKVVDCLIFAFMVQDINSIDENEEHDPYHPIIKGTYEGKYKLPNKWLKCERKILLEWNHAVRTIDGKIPFEPVDIEGFSMKKGDEMIFTVGRLDLLAWLPIEYINTLINKKEQYFQLLEKALNM